MEKTEGVAGNTRIPLQWPNERGDLTATLGRALEPVLVPLGFEMRPDPRGDDFVRARNDTTMTVCGVGYDDHPYYACDVLLSMRHHVVERLIASVIAESTSSATWTLRLSTLENKAGSPSAAHTESIATEVAPTESGTLRRFPHPPAGTFSRREKGWSSPGLGQAPASATLGVSCAVGVGTRRAASAARRPNTTIATTSAMNAAARVAST